MGVIEVSHIHQTIAIMKISFLNTQQTVSIYSELDMQAELQRIIECRLLSPVFQPIIALDSRRILGYEALIRGPENSPLHTPDQLFSTARTTKQLASLSLRVALHPVKNLLS